MKSPSLKLRAGASGIDAFRRKYATRNSKPSCDYPEYRSLPAQRRSPQSQAKPAVDASRVDRRLIYSGTPRRGSGWCQ